MRLTRGQASTSVATVLVGMLLSASAAGEARPASSPAQPAPASPPAAATAGATAAPKPVAPAPVVAQALDAKRARAALAAVPALAPLADRFSAFADADVDAALRRGDRSRQNIQVWTIMPALFVWSPLPEKTFWVLSGRVGTSVLLAVLEARPDATFANAGSTLIDEADVSLAIGASGEYPKQLTWSCCYGCAGEGGTIRFADDGRVEVTYR